MEVKHIGIEPIAPRPGCRLTSPAVGR